MALTVPCEVTCPYQGDDGPAGPPQQGLQVALAGERGPQLAGAIQALLRKRLRFMGLVVSAIYGCFAITSAFRIFRDLASFSESWFYYPLF